MTTSAKSPRRRAPTAAVIGAAALAWIACDSQPDREVHTADSAVLVTLDTTRFDAVSAYGTHRDTTPALDRLAEESVRYLNGRTVAPITVPAHASMLTGLYPPEHGLRDNGSGALPAGAVTVAERAAAAGLDTAAFVAALVLDREIGLDQGFETYDQPQRPAQRKGGHFTERPAAEVIDAALAWLDRRQPEARFFLWVHLFDPHAPHADSYLEDVGAMDRELGRFFDSLRSRGHLDRAAVLVVADHGEDLDDHGEATHSALIYDTTIRVPMLLRYPDGHRAGTLSDETVSVIDVGPTLCDALGLEPLESTFASSLWTRRLPAVRRVYFESMVGYLSYGWAPLVGSSNGTNKYIHGPEPEYYFPIQDPLERQNTLTGDSVASVEDQAFIEQVLSRTALAAEAQADTASLERLDELAALGYANAAPRGVDIPSPFAPTDRPHAHTRLDELSDYLDARSLMDSGDLRGAVQLLDGIVQTNPLHVAALDRLGLCFVLVQGWPEAIEILEQRLATSEGPGSTYVNLALAYEHSERLPEAEQALLRALELNPASATAAQNLERVRGRIAAE